jgi:hypothetical protein
MRDRPIVYLLKYNEMTLQNRHSFAPATLVTTV